MAQEARLNLRMQRELKLLLTDPPHGASFPSLTSSSSLSSIHAQIEGPEGTVYANGFFKLKIQIPERYPFQPPIVTFVTPIYHPNIDNGGRICLDILNLPPKGAWQPSLNISTVITSIGLLLSEPNPDDGLMHDASTEYKYNRQAFDQKARSMTQKYARAEGNDGCHDQEIQNLTDSKEGLVEAKESNLPNAEVPDHFINQKRLFGLSRKLSLDTAGHGQRHSGGTANEVPLSHAFNKQMEAGEFKPVTNEPTECSLNQDKVQQSTKKLSPELVSPSEVRIGGKKDFMVQTQCSTWLEPQSVLLNNADTLPLPQAGRCSTANPNNSDMRNFSTNESAKKLQLKPTGVGQKSEELEKLLIKPQLSPQLQFAASCQTFSLSETPHHNNNPHKNAADQNRNGFSTRHKKLGLAGRKHSFGTSSSSQSQQKDNKENLAPSQNLPLSNSDTRVDSTSSLIFPSEIDDTCDAWTKKSSNPCGTSTKLPLLAVEQFGENKDKSVQSDFQSGKPSALQVNHRLPCEDLFDNRQHKLLNKEKELEFNRNIKHQEKGSPKCEAAIVLDSEDSEDERILHKRSKLSLARRRIPGKRKA